jgi:hypothetical protein
MSLLRRIGLALATGYIWFFFGERVFWPFLRPDDSPWSLVVTWLIYSLFAYICLICIAEFRVKNFLPVFLVAALFGWLNEGLFSLTFFGLPNGMPFPISIAWTGLAWHAMFILLGWYVMRRALSASIWWSFVGATALGVVWGVWSLSWPLQDLTITPDSHIIYTLVCAALYIFAFHISSWTMRLPAQAGPQDFRASEGEKIFLAIVAGSYYLLVTVRMFPIRALTILPILFGLIYLALRQNKKAEGKKKGEGSILELFGERLLWRRSLLLFVAPCIASAIFASGHYGATNAWFLLTLVPISTILFVWSIIKTIRVARA